MEFGMLATVTGFFFGLCTFLFVAISLILIVLILLQKGRGGGFAGAFGGAGGNTAFGAKTGDVLTWATSIIFGVFLLLAMILNLLTNNMSAKPPLGGATAPAQTQQPAQGK
jgi:preprotein translocase subunit SecG